MSETIEVDSIEELRALPPTTTTVVIRGFPMAHDVGEVRWFTPEEYEELLRPPNPPPK